VFSNPIRHSERSEVTEPEATGFESKGKLVSLQRGVCSLGSFATLRMTRLWV